jgi:hypothetical protein
MSLQHLNMAQLRNDLFGLVSLPSRSLVFLKAGKIHPNG